MDCEMYDCPTRERPVQKVTTLRAARSTKPTEMWMCQTCIDDGWADEVHGDTSTDEEINTEQ